MIDANSAEGISGSVDITGPRADLNGSLVALAGDLRGAAAQDNCAGRSNRPRSNLTEPGRGGITKDPDMALPALYLAGREIEVKPDQADPLLRVGLPLADVQASQCR